MITRHVCPQMDPAAVEELTKAATATARDKLQMLETVLLESLTSSQKEKYMCMADMREEIAVLETEALIAQLHCPTCPKKGSNSSCPE